MKLLNLLVADNISLLADGKAVATGIYADHQVLLTDPEAEKLLKAKQTLAIQSLCIMVSIEGVEPGAHRVQFTLTPPPGGQARVTIQPIEKVEGSEFGSVNLIVSLYPFLVDVTGDFKLTVKFDDEEVSGSFRVATPSEIKAAKSARSLVS